jgi:hypothetical protein
MTEERIWRWFVGLGLAAVALFALALLCLLGLAIFDLGAGILEKHWTGSIPAPCRP